MLELEISPWEFPGGGEKKKEAWDGVKQGVEPVPH